MGYIYVLRVQNYKISFEKRMAWRYKKICGRSGAANKDVFAPPGLWEVVVWETLVS